MDLKPARRKITRESIARILALSVCDDRRILRGLVTGIVLQAVADLAAWCSAWRERDTRLARTVLEAFNRAVEADDFLTAAETASTFKFTLAEAADALELDADRLRRLAYQRLEESAMGIVWRGPDAPEIRELRRRAARREADRLQFKRESQQCDTSTPCSCPPGPTGKSCNLDRPDCPLAASTTTVVGSAEASGCA